MKDVILALNAGSSSIKFSLFESTRGSDALPLIYRGEVAGLTSQVHFLVWDAQGQRQADVPFTVGEEIGHEEALSVLLGWIEGHEAGMKLIAIGHRVVHGGTLFASPVLVDPTVFQQLEQLVPLAPLHQPHNLAAIRAAVRLQPNVPQVACFDTAFHRAQPTMAQAFALPRELTALGIRRYGFHGLSYEYIAHVLWFSRVGTILLSINRPGPCHPWV